MRIAIIPTILRVSFMLTHSGTDFSIVVSDSETGIPRNINGNGGPNGEDYLGPVDAPPTDRPLNLLYPWKDFPVRSPLYPGVFWHVTVSQRFSLFLRDRVILLDRYPPPRTTKVKEVVRQFDILIDNLAEIYRARAWCLVPLRKRRFIPFDLGTFVFPRSADCDRSFGLLSSTVRAQIR